MAPSGVAKERVAPEDLFELDEDFSLREAPRRASLKLSECAPLFEAIYRRFDAGAVIHTHSIAMVLATRRNPAGKTLEWERLEMIKGIRGAAYPERHTVPIIENTPREGDLLAALESALEQLPAHSHAVFVRNHGAYIWGADAMEATRHAEVYDWLCEFSRAEALERRNGEPA